MNALYFIRILCLSLLLVEVIGNPHPLEFQTPQLPGVLNKGWTDHLKIVRKGGAFMFQREINVITQKPDANGLKMKVNEIDTDHANYDNDFNDNEDELLYGTHFVQSGSGPTARRIKFQTKQRRFGAELAKKLLFA